MKKVFSLTVFLLTCFLFLISQTKADSCSYKEQQALNKEASNVKINYEIVDRRNEIKDENIEINNYFYINIIISNLTDNLYINAKNDYDNKEVKYFYSDSENGSIFIKGLNIRKVINYSFEIYANTSCFNNKIITKKIKTPKYNSEFYNRGICINIPEYKYCQEFIDNELSINSQAKKINDYYNSKYLKNNQAKNDNQKINIKLLLVIILSIIIVGGLIVLFIFLRKRKRKI